MPDDKRSHESAKRGSGVSTRTSTALRRFTLTLCLLLAGAVPAAAHPHVFVQVSSRVVFDAAGKVTAIKHVWTFDEMYTAFAIQGMGQDGNGPSPAELHAIAQQNIEDLEQYGWFTHGRGPQRQMTFAKPTEYETIKPKDGNLELHFTLPLEKPVSVGKVFTFEVYDPSYFVAFSYDKKAMPTLENAPAGCSVSLYEPKPLDPVLQAKLNESFFTNMSPGDDFGVQMAQRVIVACP